MKVRFDIHTKNYTTELVLKHGPDYALKMMERCLEISRNTSTLFYDEAEYVSNEHGNFELARTQSKKLGQQDKRISKNINFYSEVIRLIKKGLNNEKS